MNREEIKAEIERLQKRLDDLDEHKFEIVQINKTRYTALIAHNDKYLLAVDHIDDFLDTDGCIRIYKDVGLNVNITEEHDLYKIRFSKK